MEHDTNQRSGLVGPRRRSLWLFLSVLLSFALLAAACGDDDDSAAESDAPAAEPEAPAPADAEDTAPAVDEAPAGPEPVTITIADNLTIAGPSEALNRAIAGYEELNPHVTIIRESQAFDDYQTTLRLRASSEDGPDLIEMNVGPGGLLAQMVRADLVRELDDYSAQYGWDDRVPASLLAPSRFSDGGRVEGSGSLYGIPTGQAEVCGAFYNKALLAELGLEIPTTFEEFEASLEAAKAAGITPIVVGGLDQWPWGISYMALSNVLVEEPQDVIDWFNGVPGTTYDLPGNVVAAEVLHEWAQNEYFAAGSDGMTDEAAGQLFASGEALYSIQGPWANAGYEAGLGSDLGFFVFPAPGGGVAAATGSPGWSLGITRVSEIPDEAAHFLDYLTQPEARIHVLEAEIPPAYPGEVIGIDPDTSLFSIIEAYNEVLGAGLLVPYHDNAYPYDPNADIYAGFQSVAAGQMGASDFTGLVQEGWSTFHESLAG